MTVQPSFSTSHCKILDYSILRFYTSPVSAAMVPRRPFDFFRTPITTRPERSRRIPRPSQCQLSLPGKQSSVTQVAPNLPSCKPSNLQTSLVLSPRRTSHLSPLEATHTRMPVSVHSKGLTGKLSPLDATLTKNTGWGTPNIPTFKRSSDPPVPLQGTTFGATIPPGTKQATSRGKQISPCRCLRVVSGHRELLDPVPGCKSCLSPAF
jgi:hypothetical protein